jgi:hypothetical protein
VSGPVYRMWAGFWCDGNLPDPETFASSESSAMSRCEEIAGRYRWDVTKYVVARVEVARARPAAKKSKRRAPRADS